MSGVPERDFPSRDQDVPAHMNVNEAVQAKDRTMVLESSAGATRAELSAHRAMSSGHAPMSAGPAPDTQYRSRPVAVAVDPVSLVISECISVTSVMRKHARWAHSSVSSILGGNPNPVALGPPSPLLRPGSKGSSSSMGGADGMSDVGIANRWGLRGQKGKSMADNPLMAGFGRLRHELSGCKGEIEEATAPTAVGEGPL
jgi:golgi-specific brefeldin A-resistance guanine nucleotide exchange factor 1